MNRKINMNRKIRFRIWDKKTCEWYKYTDFIALGILEKESDDVIGRYNIMQYVGMYDMCGVDIFEGDILRVPSYLTRYDRDRDFVVCEYVGAKKYSLCGAFALKDRFGNVVESYGWDDFEIVGNIFDTPELLETDDYDGGDNQKKYDQDEKTKI